MATSAISKALHYGVGWDQRRRFLSTNLFLGPNTHPTHLLWPNFSDSDHGPDMRTVSSMAVSHSPQYLARRPAILGLAKVLLLAIAQLPFVRAAPFHASANLFASTKDEGKSPEDPNLWLYLGIAAILVLLGGAFAGLTIALMGQVG